MRPRSGKLISLTDTLAPDGFPRYISARVVEFIRNSKGPRSIPPSLARTKERASRGSARQQKSQQPQQSRIREWSSAGQLTQMLICRHLSFVL